MHSVAPAFDLFEGASGGFVLDVVRSPGVQATRTTNATAIEVRSDLMARIIGSSRASASPKMTSGRYDFIRRLF